MQACTNTWRTIGTMGTLLTTSSFSWVCLKWFVLSYHCFVSDCFQSFHNICILFVVLKVPCTVMSIPCMYPCMYDVPLTQPMKCLLVYTYHKEGLTPLSLKKKEGLTNHHGINSLLKATSVWSDRCHFFYYLAWLFPFIRCMHLCI